MKKLVILVLAFNLIPFAARAETDLITVNGMVCAFCAQGLEKSFGKIGIIDKINVNLDNMLVTLHIKDGQVLDDGTIRQAIKENGLDTVKIERTSP